MPKKLLVGGGAVLLAAVLFTGLVLGKVLHLNTPSKTEYPIWGVDVSEYQGEIDWQQMADQDVRFAFIRASEGSGYSDATFAANWQGALDAGIPAGAYHFFSFDSQGDTQADRFISTVPTGGTLPPVVDVELYGSHKTSPPDAETVREQLDVLLARLKEHYGQKPILYATGTANRRYLAGHYDEYDLWLRDVYFKPSPSAGATFWQYSDRGQLDGYNGEEKYIDLNVFCGSEAEWQTYLAKSQA